MFATEACNSVSLEGTGIELRCKYISHLGSSRPPSPSPKFCNASPPACVSGWRDILVPVRTLGEAGCEGICAKGTQGLTV